MTPILHHCHTDSLSVAFQGLRVRKEKSSNCLLVSKSILAVIGSLGFHMNFSISLSMSAEKTARILAGCEINSLGITVTIETAGCFLTDQKTHFYPFTSLKLGIIL